MASAYFPGDESERFSSIKIISPERTEPRMAATAENAFIEFPKSRGILWDRQARSPPKFLRAEEVLPSLLLGPSIVRPFLQQLMKGDGTDLTVEKVVSVTPSECLADDDLKALRQRSLKTAILPKYVLDMCDSRRDGMDNDMCLTIPISLRPAEQVQQPFDARGTAQLMSNLGKSVRSARDFSLRSCIRIRANGSPARVDGQLKGSLRFEAVMPDVSFQLVAVNPLAMLPTPLSLSLSRQVHAAGPRMGFLTLNQMRKCVPLLETDPALSAVPLVGVWCVGVPGISPEAMLDHPVVWAAALRFLTADVVRERVWAASKTFLLAVFPSSSSSSSSTGGDGANNGPCFFETTWIMPAVPNMQVPLALRAAEEFVVQDFVMDLQAEADDGSALVPAALGRFRQVTRTEHLDMLRAAAKVLTPGAANAVADAAKTKKASATTTLPLRAPALLSQSCDIRASPGEAQGRRLTSQVAQSWSPAVEGPTPIPRMTIPVPSAAVIDRDNTSVFTSGSSSSAAAASTIPSEIILAQQIQIDALRNQVEELRRIVMALGAAGGGVEVAASNSKTDGLALSIAGTDTGFTVQKGNGEKLLSAPTLSQEPVVTGVAVGTVSEPSACLSERSGVSRSTFSMQLSDSNDDFDRGTGVEVSELGSSCVMDESRRADLMSYLEPPSVPQLDERTGRLVFSGAEERHSFEREDENFGIPPDMDGERRSIPASVEALLPAMALPSTIMVDRRPDYHPCVEEESESILAIQAKYS